jgi:hypothetical protein
MIQYSLSEKSRYLGSSVAAESAVHAGGAMKRASDQHQRCWQVLVYPSAFSEADAAHVPLRIHTQGAEVLPWNMDRDLAAPHTDMLPCLPSVGQNGRPMLEKNMHAALEGHATPSTSYSSETFRGFARIPLKASLVGSRLPACPNFLNRAM